MSEELLTRCPHCNCALRIPADFLGRTVSCLECRAPFTAPVRDGDGLTAPIKLPKPSRIPARLFVPTFGLLLLGFAGMFVNGYLAVWMHLEPGAAAKFAEANFLNMLAIDPPAKAKNEEESQKREEDAQRQQQLAKEAASQVNADGMKRTRILFALMSAGVAAGGICFMLRSGYVWCFVACALAAVNSPDIGCCFLGIVVGIWGFMALISDEGRRHFGRDSLPPVS